MNRTGIVIDVCLSEKILHILLEQLAAGSFQELLAVAVVALGGAAGGDARVLAFDDAGVGSTIALDGFGTGSLHLTGGLFNVLLEEGGGFQVDGCDGCC